MEKQRNLRRIALGLAVTIIVIGVVFMLLDILDIAEYYRLNWPIAVVNTIFISGVAVVTVVFASISYLWTISCWVFL